MRALLFVVATAHVAHAQAPCITSFRSAERVRLDANTISFCDDETPKKQQCFATDLSTGKTTTTKIADAPARSDGPTLSIDGKRAKVCAAPGKCKTLVPKARVDEGLAMHGSVAGNLAVLINRSEVETFDVKTGKRIAGFTAGKGDCSRVMPVAGDVLLVQNQFCGEDEKGTHWFASTKGKKLGAVPTHVTDFVVLGDKVAFVAFAGDEVFVQEAKTGKVTQRVRLGKGGEVWPMLDGDAKRLVVVFGNERAGDIAVIDLATDKVTSHAAKRCD